MLKVLKLNLLKVFKLKKKKKNSFWGIGHFIVNFLFGSFQNLFFRKKDSDNIKIKLKQFFCCSEVFKLFLFSILMKSCLYETDCEHLCWKFYNEKYSPQYKRPFRKYVMGSLVTPFYFWSMGPPG